MSSLDHERRIGPIGAVIGPPRTEYHTGRVALNRDPRALAAPLAPLRARHFF